MMPTDIQITTEMLLMGTLIFAVIDAIYIPLLIWRVQVETFSREMKLTWNEQPWHFATNFLLASMGNPREEGCWRYNRIDNTG